MIYLKDFVKMCRSKNAGAFVLTIDIMFITRDAYYTILDRKIITALRVAELYKCMKDDVIITPYPEIAALKVTIPRRQGSGDISDSDLYGAQQHVPLMLLSVSE